LHIDRLSGKLDGAVAVASRFEEDPPAGRLSIDASGALRQACERQKKSRLGGGFRIT